MKELYRAVTNRRPILAMLEPDSTQDGGLDERDITKLLTDQYLDKFELRKKWEEWKKKGTVVADGYQDHAPTSEDVVRALFATSPVEWSRLPHFQDVTLRLIAQKGVLQGEGRAEQKLSLDGEVAMKTVALPEPLEGRSYHLFCSRQNAGAAELAEELQASGVISDGELKWTTNRDHIVTCDHMLVLLDDAHGGDLLLVVGVGEHNSAANG